MLKRQNWKKLGNIWLKLSGISILSAGGFGILGFNENIKNSLLKIAIDKSQIPIDFLTKIYISTIIFLTLSFILSLVGVASSKSENSNEPVFFFIPAFAFAWLSNLSGYTIVVDSILLTLVAHLSA